MTETRVDSAPMDNLRLRFVETSKELASLVDSLHKGALSIRNNLELMTVYEELSSLLYQVRSRLPTRHPFRIQAEDIFSKFSQDIITRQRESRRVDRTYAEKYMDYRRVWRENFSLFVFTVVLFAVSTLVGWAIVRIKPHYASLFLSQNLMEMILDQKAWFQDQGSPLFMSLQIAYHNMSIALMSFLFAGIFGLGGLWYLGFNGLYFGAIFAFCYSNQFHEALGSFVIAHGVLELTLIVCATFSGLLFGRVFFMRPRKLFKMRMQMAADDALTVVTGVLPWFLLCGLVEGFVSPTPDIPLFARWAIGLGISLVFWVWTFWPLKETKLDGR